MGNLRILSSKIGNNERRRMPRADDSLTDPRLSLLIIIIGSITIILSSYACETNR